MVISKYRHFQYRKISNGNYPHKGINSMFIDAYIKKVRLCIKSKNLIVQQPVSQFPLDQVAEERGVEEEGEPEDDEQAGDDHQQEQPEPWHVCWIINWRLELWY